MGKASRLKGKRGKDKTGHQGAGTRPQIQDTAGMAIDRGLKSYLADYQWLIAFALAFFLCAVLRLTEAPLWNAKPFQIAGEKLLATHDAYLWVAVAKGHGRWPSAPMADIVNFFHALTGMKIGNLAFWLPVFLSPLLALPLCLLARTWKISEAGIVSGVLAGSVFGYLLRTRVGYYDTDILTLFFPASFACGLMIWLDGQVRVGWSRNGQSLGRRKVREPLSNFNLTWSFGLGALGWAYYWFHPGAQPLVFPFLALAILLWGLLSGPERNYEFLFNFLFIYAISFGHLSGLVLSLFLALGLRLMPSGLRNARNIFVVLALSFLVVAWQTDLLAVVGSILDKAFYWAKTTKVETETREAALSLPSITQSIREAQDIDWNQVALRCAGGWFAFVSGLLGLGYLLWKRPLALIFLPFFVLGLASVKLGNRFTMYAGLGWGVGLGFGLSLVLLHLRLAAIWRWLVQTLICVVAVWPIVQVARELTPAPILPQPFAQSFLDLQTKTPPQARLWQWWDYGYAAQYYAGRMSFCDGGLNNGKWVYPLAVVHATDSPLQASQLMKLITWYQKKDFEQNGITGLVANWYPQFYLADPLACFKRLTPVQAQAKLDDLAREKQSFPKDLPPQYFVVSWENLKLAYWISYFGHWDMSTGQTTPGMIQRLVGTVNFDLKNGRLIFRGKNFSIQNLDVVGGQGDRHYFWAGNSDMHCVLNEYNKEMFLMNGTIYHSLLVQMLIKDPSRFKPYFTLVEDRFPWARAYQVN